MGQEDLEDQVGPASGGHTYRTLQCVNVDLKITVEVCLIHQITAVKKKMHQSSLKVNYLFIFSTIFILGLPGDVCVCDTFQGSCQQVF